METPLSPGTVRRVTQEDRKRIVTELGPLFNKLSREAWSMAKGDFARRHGLTVTQVDVLILELRRKSQIG